MIIWRLSIGKGNAMSKHEKIQSLRSQINDLTARQNQIQKLKQKLRDKVIESEQQPDDPEDIAKDGNAIASRWRGTSVDLEKNIVARYVMQLEDEVRKLKGQLKRYPTKWSLEETQGEITIKLGYKRT